MILLSVLFLLSDSLEQLGLLNVISKVKLFNAMKFIIEVSLIFYEYQDNNLLKLCSFKFSFTDIN